MRECRKLIFQQLESGKDRDAASVAAAMTPARAEALKPRSMLQVLDAVDGACASAPPFTELASTARAVLMAARDGLSSPPKQAPPEQAPPQHSPLRRHSSKRRMLSTDEDEAYSPHFSPHLQPAGGVSGSNVREQLLALFRTLSEAALAHLLLGKSDVEKRACVDDELERLHAYQCARHDELRAQLLQLQHTEARWRAPNVRAELRSMSRVVKEHFEPFANRSADGAVDKPALLAAIKKACPTAYTMLKLTSTTGNEKRNGGRVLSKSSPEQKMVDGLVPFSILAAIGRPNTPIMELPLRVILHQLATARGASRTQMRLWCALRITPMPNRIDAQVTDPLNAVSVGSLHGSLEPGALVTQQMETRGYINPHTAAAPPPPSKPEPTVEASPPPAPLQGARHVQHAGSGVLHGAAPRRMSFDSPLAAPRDDDDDMDRTEAPASPEAAPASIGPAPPSSPMDLSTAPVTPSRASDEQRTRAIIASLEPSLLCETVRRG